MWKNNNNRRTDRQTDSARCTCFSLDLYGLWLASWTTFLWLIRLSLIDADSWLVGASALLPARIAGILKILRRSLQMIFDSFVGTVSRIFEILWIYEKYAYSLYKCCTVAQHSESQVWTGCGRSFIESSLSCLAKFPELQPSLGQIQKPNDFFRTHTHPHQA